MSCRWPVRERPGEERSRPPAIVLCVDQAEELFQAEGAEESRAFLKLLQHHVVRDWSAKAQTDPLRVIVLFTIRTDGYGPLQAASELTGLSQTMFSLPPMPQGAYEATIEPAHEALLRQWAVLDGWLKEDQGLLSSLEGVLSATRDWEANARSDDWLAHTAGRLEDAERLLLRPPCVREVVRCSTFPLFLRWAG